MGSMTLRRPALAKLGRVVSWPARMARACVGDLLVRLGCRHPTVEIDVVPALLHPGDRAERHVLRARAAPRGGKFQWTLPHEDVISFSKDQPDGHGPTEARVMVTTVGRGTVDVTAVYRLGGADKPGMRRVEVRTDSCSRVLWTPPGAPIEPRACSVCQHADRAIDDVKHWHGGACVCRVQQQPVHHWVLADGEATSDVRELYRQIDTLRSAPAHARPALVAQWPWFDHVPIEDFQLSPGKQGKMLGILRGRDAVGAPIRLRAVSGWGFHTRRVDALRAGHHTYWSPAPPKDNFFSASRGFQSQRSFLPDCPPSDRGKLGKCAAISLLSHALELQVSIESMAEIWVGSPTPDGIRRDGELQASCGACLTVLGFVLCEDGGGARSKPFSRVEPGPPRRGMS